jgi:hypothetical protein
VERTCLRVRVTGFGSLAGPSGDLWRGPVGWGGPASPRMFQPMFAPVKALEHTGEWSSAMAPIWHTRPTMATRSRDWPDTAGCERLDSLSVFPQVRPHFEPCSAEGVGFEPTMTVTRHTGFQDRTFSNCHMASDLRKHWG